MFRLSVARLPAPRLAAALALACTLAPAAPARSAPLLRSTTIDVAMESPTRCTVTMTVAVEGAGEVEHRVESFPGSAIELLTLSGAVQAGVIREVGPTRALVVRPDASSYTVGYRASQPPDRAGRCPIWVPALPTDGRSRDVRLTVTLSDRATAGYSMPPLAWAGSIGTAALGHVPAFVRVSAGQSSRWNVATAMDAAAVVIFAGATVLWMRRRGR
jgi:hypothetical protein